jgi:hypothetical protein
LYLFQSSQFLQFVVPQNEVLPQITPFNFGDEEDINLDEAVAVTCIITKGDAPIKIWWTLVDDFTGLERNLTTNDGVMITRTNQKMSMLAIEAVKSRHRSNYTCHAKNKAGIAHFSAFLSVNGDFDLKFDIFPFFLGILQFVDLSSASNRSAVFR